MLPVEQFKFMGIGFNEDVVASFPDSLIRDLAGNAFDGSSFLAAWVTLQSILAHISARTDG